MVWKRETSGRSGRERRNRAAAGRNCRTITGVARRIGHVAEKRRDSTVNSLGEIGKAQRGQFELFSGQLTKLIESNEKKLGELRNTVETKLAQIQTDNAAKLEEMRKTVDEKLQGLWKTAGESFKLVSERLNKFTKVWAKCRRWHRRRRFEKSFDKCEDARHLGEIQLGNLLEQILTAEQ